MAELPNLRATLGTPKASKKRAPWETYGRLTGSVVPQSESPTSSEVLVRLHFTRVPRQGLEPRTY